MTVQKPSPLAVGESQPYWEGANQGRLVLQQCSGCGQLRHYAQVTCPACYSTESQPVPAAGTGTIHSWTISHHAFHPGFADDLPYALVTVDLAEGVRAMGRLDELSIDDLKVGLAVRATFPKGDDGFGRLTFVPA
ncbi:MAG: Zn-ribbon domain-containing OB-fold protein [Hyphomicrobiaceae bacterium]